MAKTKNKKPRKRSSNKASTNAPAKVAINERQIAGSAAGGESFGTEFVLRLSDWLQAKGKIVLGVIALALLASLVFIVLTSLENQERSEIFAEILKAQEGEDLEDVQKKFDALLENVEEEPKYLPSYHYYYAKSLWKKSSQAQDRTKKEQKQDREETLDQIKLYFAAVEKHQDQALSYRKPELEAIKQAIIARRDFLEKDSRSQLLEKSDFKAHPDPEIVSEDQLPVVVFRTNKGSFKITLYETANLENSVNTLMTLVQRGYFKNAQASFVKGPGIGKSDDALFKEARLIGFGERGKLKELPKDSEAEPEASESEDEDKDEKKELEPYFTIRPEHQKFFNGEELLNKRGSIMLYFNPAQPLKRGAQFAVNLSDNFQLDGIYQVIGNVSEGLEILETLTTSDTLYDAYIEKKRDHSYIPSVIFLDQNETLGIPQPWLEVRPKPEAPRIKRVKEAKIIGEGENPQVVISTEKGDVLVELFEDITPNTVANFIYLVESGHYKKSNFHRVGGPFVENSGDKSLRIIQGGRKNNSENFDWTIRNEAVDNEAYQQAPLRNITSTLAMARTSDLDSAGCQFFVNLKEMPQWDNEDSPYCVFGRVVENLWTLYNIRKDDEIIDAWVVQKRDHSYDPEVKGTGKTTYQPASELKAKN